MAELDGRFDAVFVGFITLDISGRPVHALPDGGGIAFLDEIRINPAGTMGGAVMNAAKMGIRTSCVGCVGADEKGDIIVDRFARMGIDTTFMQRSAKTGTSSTILPIRPNGDRPCLHARGASEELFVHENNFDAVCNARFLHHGGTGFIRAMEDGQSVKLLAHAKAKGLTVTFDLIGPHDGTLAQLKPLLPLIDYFMPSMEEAAFISGLTAPEDITQFFMDLGAKACVIKWGAKGSFIRTEDGAFRMPAFAVDVSDTTGCGDAYCGGFIAGLALGYDLEKACRLGTATSGLVATGLGSDAGVVDLATTLDFAARAKLRD
jgi:sugar/nucleoside kinase (ribokinase family)